MNNNCFLCNKIKVAVYFILIIELCLKPVFSEPVSLEDIKSTLDEQNKILTQQKDTIENLRLQNKGLEKLIETYSYNYTSEYEETFIEPVQEKKWGGSFSARTGLRIGDWVSSIVGSASDSSITTVNFAEPRMWVNGGAISVNSPWFPNTSFIVSGVYGNSNSDVTTISTFKATPEFDAAITASGNLKVDFIDTEFLIRTAIQDTNLNWTVGFQYMQIDFTSTLSSSLVSFPQPSLEIKQKLQIFVPKVGIGGYMELAENHRIFSNLLFFMGYGRVSGSIRENLFVVGGDINFGYQWVINRSFSVSPRYRFQTLYEKSQNQLSYRNQFFILHGPELNLTYHF